MPTKDREYLSGWSTPVAKPPATKPSMGPIGEGAASGGYQDQPKPTVTLPYPLRRVQPIPLKPLPPPLAARRNPTGVVGEGAAGGGYQDLPKPPAWLSAFMDYLHRGPNTVPFSYQGTNPPRNPTGLMGEGAANGSYPAGWQRRASAGSATATAAPTGVPTAPSTVAQGTPTVPPTPAPRRPDLSGTPTIVADVPKPIITQTPTPSSATPSLPAATKPAETADDPLKDIARDFVRRALSVCDYGACGNENLLPILKKVLEGYAEEFLLNVPGITTPPRPEGYLQFMPDFDTEGTTGKRK